MCDKVVCVCDKAVCVTKLYVREMCVTKLCDNFVCERVVCERVVCVWQSSVMRVTRRRRWRRTAGDRIQNQKQELHTKMWGKKETHGSHAFPSVVSSKLRDGNRNIKPQLYTQCGFDDMLASSHVTVKSAPEHEVQSDVVRRPAIKQSQSPKT